MKFLPLVWKNIVGMPVWCKGSQAESPTPELLKTTATTSSSTIRFPQSVAPAGSPPVSHVTISIGRPPGAISSLSATMPS